MLNLEEYRPHFLAFHRAMQEGLPEVKKGHCEQFARFLERLYQRVRWEAPLIVTLEQGREFGAEFEVEFRQVREQLKNGEPRPQAVNGLHRSLEQLYLVQQHLPVFTDSRVLNEILVLLSGDLAGLSDSATDAVEARLPLALDWIKTESYGWQHFFELFPEKSPLLERVSAALSALKGACGGLFSAIESGSVSEEAKPAGDLILNALKELAELHSSRHTVERGRFGEGDLLLARVIESLHLGEELSEPAERELAGFVLDRSRALEALKLKLTWDEPPDEAAREKVTDQSRQLADLYRRWKNQELTNLEAAAFFDSWEQDFQTRWKGEERALLDGSNFEEVVLKKQS